MASNFPLRVARGWDQGSVRLFPVKAAQTFIVGQLLKLTSNEVEAAGDTATAIIGMAMAPASVGLDAAGSLYGGTKIPVYIPGPNTEFFIASATTPVFATHNGVLYGQALSTNILLDISNTTQVPFKVVGIQLSPLLPEGFFVVPNLGYWVASGVIS